MEAASISALFEEARERIRSFATLSTGWDDSDAQPVSDQSIEQASRLLNAFASAARPPKVYPTPMGGVQLEYEGTNDYLEVEITGNHVTMYVESEDQEYEVKDQGDLIEAVMNAT